MDIKFVYFNIIRAEHDIPREDGNGIEIQWILICERKFYSNESIQLASICVEFVVVQCIIEEEST